MNKEQKTLDKVAKGFLSSQANPAIFHFICVFRGAT